MSIAIEPLLFLGWLAVIGGLLNTVGDWAMLGFPIAGKEIKLELLKDKPLKHVRFGVYIAMLVLPLWLGILFPLLYLLQTTSVWHQAVVSVSLLLFVMFSLVYHISYIFLDITFREGHEPSIARAVAEKERMQRIILPVSLVMSIGLLVSGLAASAPIWWLVLNPLLIFVVLLVLGKALPSPIGSYVLSGGGSFGFALFCLSTMLAVSTG